MESKIYTELDYFISVDLTDYEKAGVKRQLVYSSQLYQSYFEIYAAFHTKGKKETVLEKVELELLHYKGTVPLGFVKDSLLIEEYEENFRMEFKLVALTDSDKIEWPNNANPWKDLKFKTGKYIYVKRTLIPAEKTKIFHDTEFYDRDGSYRVSRSMPGLHEFDIGDVSIGDLDDLLPVNGICRSHRCHQKLLRTVVM